MGLESGTATDDNWNVAGKHEVDTREQRVIGRADIEGSIFATNGEHRLCQSGELGLRIEKVSLWRPVQVTYLLRRLTRKSCGKHIYTHAHTYTTDA